MPNNTMSRPSQWFGSTLDRILPGDVFNPSAPSFREGFMSSRLADALRSIREGDYRPIIGQGGQVLGQMVGGPVGRYAGRLVGNLASGSPSYLPSFGQGFSPYGPYSGGYQLPDSYVPQMPSDPVLPDWDEILDYSGASRPAAPSGGGGGGGPVVGGSSPGGGWGAAGNFSGVSNNPYLAQFGGWGGNPTGVDLASLTDMFGRTMIR